VAKGEGKLGHKERHLGTSGGRWWPRPGEHIEETKTRARKAGKTTEGERTNRRRGKKVGAFH